jgi:hypothetical protein
VAPNRSGFDPALPRRASQEQDHSSILAQSAAENDAISSSLSEDQSQDVGVGLGAGLGADSSSTEFSYSDFDNVLFDWEAIEAASGFLTPTWP